LYRKKANKGNAKGGKPIEGGSMEDFDWQHPRDEMEAVIKECTNQFNLLKVGRADPQLLESLTITENKKSVQISEVAQVNVKDGSTLIVSPFEPETTKDIVEAIRNSDLEMNPTVSGSMILVAMPKPTKEFKAKLIKLAHQHVEQAKLSIRNQRRLVITDIKKMGLPEDDDRTMQAQVQKLHDDYIKKLDNLYKQKEKDLSK